MSRRACVAAVFAILMSLTLSACGGDRDEATTPTSAASQSTGVPTAADASTEDEPLLNTPLQAYRLTPTEVATVFYARGLLIDRCMKRFGFDYPQEPFADELQRLLESERSSISRLYGLTDVTTAAQYGYGFPPGSHGPGAADEIERSDAYLFVLRGTKDINKPLRI